MALISDILANIRGDTGAPSLFDNGGQQGSLGAFGNNLIQLANPQAGTALANYKKINAEAQAQQATTDAAKRFQSGEINAEQFVSELAKYDPIAARQLALNKAGVDKPSALQEWGAFQQMTPEERSQYLGLKRAQQVVNLGGSQAVLNPTGGIKEEYDVTLRPEDQPTNAGAKAQATARGSEVGTAQGGQDKKGIAAPNIDTLITEAEKILPQSTSGAIGQAVTGGAKALGKSTDSSKADARLKVLSAALTSTVPRFEGPQGVLDVELYKQAAADVANTALPFEDRQAALGTMKDLNKRYLPNQTQAPASPAGVQEGATATNPRTGAKIIFKEGKWQPL